MTDAAPAAPERPRGIPFAAGWATALRHGLLALAVVTALGEVAALCVKLVGRTGLSLGTILRLGWLYVGLFHGVPLRLRGIGMQIDVLDAGSVESLELRFGVALLLVTWLAVWLLWRGGRAVAGACGGGALARALHGTKVAPVYALPVFALSLLVEIRSPFPFPRVISGELDLSSAPLPALLLPVAIAAAAGACGGIASALAAGSASPRARWVSAAASGGWRMLLVGLGLAYVGLFLAGIVRPEGPEGLLTPSTGRYVRAVFDRPDVGLVALAHHVAVAPNEAMWALVPSMGGCTGAYPGDCDPVRFLCYRRFPNEIALPSLPVVGAPPGQPARSVFGTAPWPYFLFLLAPALASVLGGMRAAERAAPSSARGAIALGVGSGAAFESLVVAVGWLASVRAEVDWVTGGVPEASGGVRVGPGLVGGALLALAWGALGGALGAVWRARGTGSTATSRT